MLAGMTFLDSSARRSVRHGEGEERNVARAADRELHLALVTGAVAADAAGDDLAALGHEVLERLRILVVDDQRLLRAIAADAALAAAASDVCVEVGAAVDIPVVVE